MDDLDRPLILRLGSGLLVLGLDWFPLLGAHPRRQSLRLARKQGASYFVLGSDHAVSVGLAILRLSRQHRRTPLYSAAQSLAGRFPQGTVAVALAVPEHGWWFSVVHQGAVVARTDRMYASVQLARAAMDELRPAYPQLRWLDAGTEPPAPTLDQLLEYGAGASVLHPTGRWYTSLPWPVRLFTVALLLVVVLPALWNWRGHRITTDIQPVRPDPALVWQQAIQHAIEGRSLHGPKVTAALLSSLYDLPVTIAGWQLLQAECQVNGVAWHCTSDYQRRARQASNDGFLESLPDGWSTRFPSMDLAQAGWTSPIYGQPLSWQSLKTAADTDRYLVSAWQAIRTAFTHMDVGTPSALPVMIPRDRDGQAIPRPAGLPLYMSRPIQVRGPLRSFRLLAPHTVPIEWSRVVLTFKDATQATLQNSQLSVSFQGVLHEIQTIPN